MSEPITADSILSEEFAPMLVWVRNQRDTPWLKRDQWHLTDTPALTPDKLRNNWREHHDGTELEEIRPGVFIPQGTSRYEYHFSRSRPSESL